MARAGHASPAAALRYQHAAEDRDVVIAEALSSLAETARRVSVVHPPAGYSRDDSCERHAGRIVTTPMTSADEQSGRPGSNRHHQLGRLRFYH
jgi:hypothetical protein